VTESSVRLGDSESTVIIHDDRCNLKGQVRPAGTAGSFKLNFKFNKKIKFTATGGTGSDVTTVGNK